MLKALRARPAGVALAACLVALVARPVIADTWCDSFDDGDFTHGPAWVERNNDDAPGIVEVTGEDNHVHFVRAPPPGNGGTVALDHDVALFLTRTSTITFDVNPVYSDVADGAGYQHAEYPVEIRLHLRDAQQNPLGLAFCYNYRGGSSLYEDDFIRVAFPDCQRDVWRRGESFRIREYFPQAVLIESLELAARGWGYEGCIDSVTLNDVTPRRTGTPFYGTGQDTLYIGITVPQEGVVYSPCAPDMVTWNSNIPSAPGSPDVLDLYWRECGGTWQWFADDNNDGAHPWSSAPCADGRYQVLIAYKENAGIKDVVTFEVDWDEPPPPPPGDPDLGFFVDFSGTAQGHQDVDSRADPAPYTVLDAYLGFVQLSGQAGGFTTVSFAVSVSPEVLVAPSFGNLLEGDIAIGSWEDGITLHSTECVHVPYGDVHYVARMEFFYLEGSSDILIIDHPLYPRWVVDCDDPGGVHPYCVWTHGGVAKDAQSGDEDCAPYTAVEQRSWGAVKAMFR